MNFQIYYIFRYLGGNGILIGKNLITLLEKPALGLVTWVVFVVADFQILIERQFDGLHIQFVIGLL